MRLVKFTLYCSLSLAALSFAGGCWMMSTEAASALRHVGLAADAWATAPALIAERVAAVQATLSDLPAAILPPVLKVVDAARTDVAAKADAQITALRGDVMTRVDKIETDANARTGEALAVVEGIRQDAQPALAKSAVLMDAYAILPAQIGAELRPSWLAIQPEITCRHSDGSGYGGCWHSRITGLLGEALNVGGVFTQQFPRFAISINGMAADTRAWTDKYVYPRPLTRKQKFEAAGRVVIGLGTAGLRGGIF